MITILLADDEAAPREQLAEALALAWPEAQLVAVAEHGVDAWDLWLQHQPAACFLDIRMPGLSGLEVAQKIGDRSAIVFVTAYGDHALQAFDAGAIDYLVKPIEVARLRHTVERLQQRLARPQDPSQALQQLLSRLVPPRPAALTQLQASVGKEVRMIRVTDVLYFESDSRYTRVVYRDGEALRDALLRTPLKELLTQLDPVGFLQVHRSIIVAADEVAKAVRDEAGGMVLHLRNSPDVLTVSRPFQGLFKGQ